MGKGNAFLQLHKLLYLLTAVLYNMRFERLMFSRFIGFECFYNFIVTIYI